MVHSDITYYDALDVRPDAETGEIKEAYRRMRRATHPDTGGSTGMFRLVQQAYEVLSDPARRAEYDEWLRTGRSRDGFGAPDEPAEPDASFEDEWGAEDTWETGESDQTEWPQPDESPGDGPRVTPMEHPPAAPSSESVEVTFQPPLRPSQWAPTPRWVKWWVIATGVPAASLLGLGIVGAVFAPPAPGLNVDNVISLLLYAALLALVVFGPVQRNRNKRRPSLHPLATQYLPEAAFAQRVHGQPGEGMSVGRFGEARAALGREGEERTDALVRTSLLPTYPAMYLVNGLIHPGTDHADIDHVLLLGNALIAIDSKLWRDGRYWWDGRSLYREGEPEHPPALANALAALHHYFPQQYLYGLILVHSPTGKLDQPVIENAHSSRPIAGHNTPMVNPTGLLTAVHQIAAATADRHTVHAMLLNNLLALQRRAHH